MASILVIKLSALGDLLFALPAMQAIRRHHAGDHLVLLTAERFVPLMQRTGLFDEVWPDQRPKWWQLGALLDLRQRLLKPAFARVYDLQWSKRSDLYLGLLKASDTYGATSQARHNYAGRREAQPIGERHAGLLKLAGIDEMPPADLGFMNVPPPFEPPPRFALLVPGASQRHPAKRWPLEGYITVARGLLAAGLTPLLVCGPDERDLARQLVAAVLEARDVNAEIEVYASLARRAAVVVGNDSGPTHLIALAGCPCVMLFSAVNDPRKLMPQAPVVRVLQGDPIGKIQADAVLAAALEIAR